MSIHPRSKRSTTSAPASTPTVRCYYRQSLASDKQQSIPTQKGEVERLARVLNIPAEQWAAAVEYVDVNRSGGDFEGREAFARLQAEAQPGDIILTWKLDRVSRDITLGLVFIRDLVYERRCQLYTADTGTERIKCDTADEVMLVVVRFFGGQRGREDIRKNTRDGLRARANDGYATGRLPFGYRTVLVNPTVANRKESKKRIEIDPALAPLVRRIFALYLDGRGYLSIARQLNSEGAPWPRKGRTSKRSTGWSGSTIWELLRDERYVGAWAHGITRVKKRVGDKSIMEPAPENEVIRSTRADLAIVDADTWERAQAAMVERATPMREQLNASRHTFSGITRCECGSGLSVQTDGKPGRKVVSYQCAARRTKGAGACSARFRIRASLLDEYVRAALVPWFAVVEAEIDAAVAGVTARLAAEGAPDVARIEAELAEARAQQRRLVRLAAMTDGEVAEIAAELKAGAATVRRLEADHARATAPRSDASTIGAQIRAEATSRLSALREALAGPDAKEALRTLFPDGLRLLAAPDAFKVEAIGVLQALRVADPSRTACRIPFAVSIPRAA